MSDALSLFMPRFRVLMTFTVFQNGDYRRIDNGASSGTNDVSFLQETIVCPSFEFPWLIARVMGLALEAGEHMPAMTYSLADLKAAFRTLPTANPGYTSFAIFNHSVGRVEVYYTPGHNFGLRCVVVSFNRFTELTATVMRVYHGVPCEHFYDDYMCPDVAIAHSSGIRALIMLHEDLGDEDPAPLRIRAPLLAPDKTKFPSPTNVGLGVFVDLSAVHTEYTVSFSPREGRVDEIMRIFTDSIRADCLEPTTAAILVGKLGFVCRTAYGKVGRAALLPLIQRHNHDSTCEITLALHQSYDFFRALLPNLPPLTLPIALDTRPAILLYTDASFHNLKVSKRRDACSSKLQHRWTGRMGYVLHDFHTGVFYYGTATPSRAIVRSFSPNKKTYIAQLEALAAISVYFTFPELFMGRRVNHFIDNTVALSALIHGYSRAIDISFMSNAFHLQMAGLKATAFLDFVPSLANIADLPSRNEFALLKRLGARPKPMKTPAFNDWNAPLESWILRWR